jgi:hypothetical protein
MNVNPTRFAVAITAALACLIGGVLVGVRAGAGRTGHVFMVETVTTTAAPQRADAAARTVTAVVTRTVRRTVTVTLPETVAVTVTAPAPAPGPGHRPGPGDTHAHGGPPGGGPPGGGPP